MKKSKYLALVLVVAIMMMGAGYAYWSDTLVVDAKVKTGTFDVDFVSVEQVTISPEVEASAKIVALDDGTTDNGRDRDKALVKIKNLYPSAHVRHEYKIKNVGSITAKINKIVMEKEGDIDLEMIIVAQVLDGQSFDINDGVFPDNLELNPGEEMKLDIWFRLSHDAENETTEAKDVEVKLTIEAEQWYDDFAS